MQDDAFLTFCGLARTAFQAPRPDFSAEEFQWEPALLGVRNWTELDPARMSATEALMLSQEAFLFCLPAYMIGGLQGVCQMDSVLRLLYTPGTPWDSWNRWIWHHNFRKWDRLMSQLTASQKHVIHVWLVELGARYPEEEVMGDYGTDRIRDRVVHMIHNYWGAF